MSDLDEQPLYCSDDCRVRFRQDHGVGLAYPLFQLEDGSGIPWVEASRRFRFCAYCGEPIDGRV